MCLAFFVFFRAGRLLSFCCIFQVFVDLLCYKRSYFCEITYLVSTLTTFIIHVVEGLEKNVQKRDFFQLAVTLFWFEANA